MPIFQVCDRALLIIIRPVSSQTQYHDNITQFKQLKETGKKRNMLKISYY